MGFDETRQFEVVEEILHELFARQLEHEVVLPFALVAGGLAATAASATRARNLVALYVVGVARMHELTLSASAMPERRFGDVLLRNGDALRALYVLDAAVSNGVRHRAANIVFDTTQKALAVGNALVLTG